MTVVPSSQEASPSHRPEVEGAASSAGRAEAAFYAVVPRRRSLLRDAQKTVALRETRAGIEVLA